MASKGRHPRDFSSGPFVATRWQNGEGWDITTKSFLSSTPPEKHSTVAVRKGEINHLRRLAAKLDEYERKLPPRARS